MLTGPQIVSDFVRACLKTETDLRKAAANYNSLAETYVDRARVYLEQADKATHEANAYANAAEEVACSER